MATLLLFLLLLVAAAHSWSRRCRLLRHQRLLHIHSLDPLSHAHSISNHTLFLEFPSLFRISVELALFRTFAIPSISSILQRSGRFSDSAAQRYDDTDILIHEMITHHSDTPRAATALRRLNFLHSNYPAITNDEYLYVLCVLIVWPINICNRYGHRPWSEKEKCAYFSIWRDLGGKMGIRDVFPSISDAAKFLERFEATHMTYATSNRAVADPLLALLLAEFPAFILRPLARKAVFALMDERLLAAMVYPVQPPWLRTLVGGTLKLCTGIFVGWFLPPRPLHRPVLRIMPLGCPVAPAGTTSPPPDVDSALRRVMFRRFRSQRCEYEEKGYRIGEIGALQPGKLAPPPAVAAAEMLCPFSLELWPDLEKKD